MIVSIASGKGGTGKTTIATNLAYSMSADTKVQFFDCDVEEPNAHLFFKPKIIRVEDVTIPVPEIDHSICNYCRKCSDICEFNALAVVNHRVLVFPQLCHGCGSCAVLCPRDAIIEKQREIGTIQLGYAGSVEFCGGELTPKEVLAPAIIGEMKTWIKPNRLVIIDAPPGTSCSVIESVKGSTFCILVTEPTPFGLNDLRLAVEMLKLLHIPMGVVINRADLGNDEVELYCLEEGIPVLMRIPWNLDMANHYSRGELIAIRSSWWRKKFRTLHDKINLLQGEAETRKQGERGSTGDTTDLRYQR